MMMASLKSKRNSFLSLHSPRGANAFFAMGMEGAGGGFGLHKDYVDTKREIFIGYRMKEELHLLPYFTKANSNAKDAFVQSHSEGKKLTLKVRKEVDRTFSFATDRFSSDDISFEILTPVSGVPDPAQSDPERVKDSIAPAILCKLRIDNLKGKDVKSAFFATDGLAGQYLLGPVTAGKLTGCACGEGFGFAVDAVRNPEISTFGDFDIFQAFSRAKPADFILPKMAGLVFDVLPGQVKEVDIVLAWYRPGIVTYLKDCSYYYTRFFSKLEDVALFALGRKDAWWSEGLKEDERLGKSNLNEDRRFLLAQSLRAYWTSTMFFECRGKPRWVVNEGSFLMMNTFDLTVDQVFFELEQMPWAVKNELDIFADEYSYYDTVHFPGDGKSFPGGIAFTHDQGNYHVWSPDGTSTYEVRNQPGCFSYMTHEELVNWLCCASAYFGKTNDIQWVTSRKKVFEDILVSMQNRDHPDPALRDGVMDLDSDRCGSESEITTYDSLDASLGQSRRNIYLAVKCWAGYLALERIFNALGDKDRAGQSHHAAALCAKTIVSGFNPALGHIPSILDGKDKSAIIPAIEGLVFPYYSGQKEFLSETGEFAELIRVLRSHLVNILKPGKCLFKDKGWKLSSNNINSWMSKIFLCQFIAERILDVRSGFEPESDRAHARWWKEGCTSNPAIDQVLAGTVPNQGFHYPRSVTSWLWLT